MKKQLEPEIKLVQVAKNINLSLPEFAKPFTLTIDSKEERDALKLDAKKLVESYKRSKTQLGKSRVAKKLEKMFTLEKEIVDQKVSKTSSDSKKSKIKEAIKETSNNKKKQSAKKDIIGAKSIKEASVKEKATPKTSSKTGASHRAESYRRRY